MTTILNKTNNSSQTNINTNRTINLPKQEKNSLDLQDQTIEQKNASNESTLLKNPTAEPIWLSVTEAAKLGGVSNKTIRRAIQIGKIKYKIYKNRYLISLRSLILFLMSNTKLKNKLKFNGLGQYVEKWRK